MPVTNDLTPEQEANRAALEILLGRFANDQRQDTQEWQSRQGRVPDRLYHYTTVDGMLGITGSASLWASDVRFMNDSSELHYAASLIESVVREEFDAVPIGPLSKALPAREGVANPFEYGARPFIACFCEEADLLSQWRGYGVGEAPVSLGLDLRMMSSFNRLPTNTLLRKVEYREDVQRETVRSIVRSWLRTIESLTIEGGDYALSDILPYPGIWALQEALSEHHLCFKHPGFEEEQEWRLIKLVDVREEFRVVNDRRREERLAESLQWLKDEGVNVDEHATPWSSANAEGVDIGFRRSSLGLVPYVELPLRDMAGVFTGLLPLWHVVQGPSPHPELATEALGMLLESRGYGFHTKVETSRIPLRP